MKNDTTKDIHFYLDFITASFVRFHLVIFVIFVALVYAYLFLQINSFVNAKPTLTELSNQQHSSAAIHKIDVATIQKIQQLKDNSVNVQAIFENARNNPFSQ